MWRASALRLTFFVKSGNLTKDFNADLYWKSVLDIEPTKNINPNPNNPIITLSALIEDSNLNILLQIKSGRIDWIYRLKDDINSIDQTLNSLGKLSDSLEDFKVFYQKVFEKLPQDIVRIAVGNHSHHQVNSLPRASSYLDSYLPFSVKDYTEFSFRSNKTSKSRIEDKNIVFNNIVNLDISKFEGKKIENGQMIDLGLIIAPHIETDVNTDQKNQWESGYIKNEQLESIVDYLVKKTLKIANKKVK